MYNRAEVPEADRQFLFVNSGGPSRNVVSREMVQKWAEKIDEKTRLFYGLVILPW
jgi:hypothetical protein